MTPATFVILDSHECETVTRLIITDDERLDLRTSWDRPDPLLTRLTHVPWLQGVTSWSQLDRVQLQTLIAIQMTIRNESPQHERLLSIGLRVAIIALVLQLEEDTGWVSMLRVHHLGSLHLEVDVSMSIGARMEPIHPTPPRGIRVVFQK